MRKCRHCKSELPAKKHSDRFQSAGFCDADHMAKHGIELAKKQQERSEKKKEREQRKKDRAAKERLKTLQQCVKDAQTWVNRVVVAEDREKGCISCKTGEVSDAGHCFHKGRKYTTSPLTLDRRNLNGQCRKCNAYDDTGCQHEYILGFIERYGQKVFDELVEYKYAVDRGEVPKLTKEECKAIIAESKKKLKEIKDRL